MTEAGNARTAAARVLSRVLAEGRSLSAVLPPVSSRIAPRERGLLQELCYGTLRWYPQLQALVTRLLRTPLKPRESEVQALLLLGLYQLLYLRLPDYAAVAATVAAARELGKNWATGLINGVLRNFQYHREDYLAELERDPCGRYAHPAWLLHSLQEDWPEDWPAIVAANNRHPPYSLRVNLARLSRQDYLQCLAAEGIDAAPIPFSRAGLTLAKACEAAALPGFAQGWVSVQDGAAQLAAELLAPAPGLRVLDTCAAPGGKAGHLLETEPGLALLALDKDADRLRQVDDNLRRLGLTATTRVGDAGKPADWWDGRPYDRILLDAPCSGTGVLRRHPDIKVLRRPADIAPLAARQRALLEALWSLLKPGGRLVYATCSILKRENERNLAEFLATQPDAHDLPPAVIWGRPGSPGRQILPGEADMDGFYYCVLEKG
ncbi:MAG: 16S rRNA (cytosine(967)-C(5))-methyltransferase RsmB [Candidatus Competibacteraceae bacterium]